MPASIAKLTRLIDNEVIRAVGVPADSWLADRLHALLRRATSHFSELFAEVDHIIEEQGLPAGALWLLRQLASDCEARGVENIPLDGPLIIASNHPGAVDSLALSASAGRNDLKIIASAVPFLQNLPHVSEHLIFTPRLNIQQRMISVRESIRHLRAGGALLLFAHGTIDPDPAFMPSAAQELQGWSRSLEIFVRAVPEAGVLVSIVSGVVDPGCMHNPITWLRRERPDRQRIAMMLQIIEQMLGRHIDITPRISFGRLLDKPQSLTTEQTLDVVTDYARQLMRSHIAWQA